MAIVHCLVSVVWPSFTQCNIKTLVFVVLSLWFGPVSHNVSITTLMFVGLSLCCRCGWPSLTLGSSKTRLTSSVVRSTLTQGRYKTGVCFVCFLVGGGRRLPALLQVSRYSIYLFIQCYASS